MARTLGPRSFTARDALRAPGAAQQVGDEVDRAGGDDGAVRPGELARARQRARAGRGTISACGPPSCAASEASVAGGSARGLGEAREHGAARSARSSARSIAAGVLVVEDRDDADERPRGRSGSAAASASMPAGLCAPSTIVSGRSATTWKRPGHRDARGGARGPRRVERAEHAPRAAARATAKFVRW